MDREEEEVQRAPLIVAAWLESIWEQGREFDLQSDPAWQAALAWWRQDHPANELADYAG